MTKKERAYQLFNEGKTVSSPEVKALGMKSSTRHSYYCLWQKAGRPSSAPGTPGEEVWTFEALKRGTVTTFLEYSRPWIEEDVGYWTVTITTTIK